MWNNLTLLFQGKGVDYFFFFFGKKECLLFFHLFGFHIFKHTLGLDPAIPWSVSTLRKHSHVHKGAWIRTVLSTKGKYWGKLKGLLIGKWINDSMSQSWNSTSQLIFKNEIIYLWANMEKPPIVIGLKVSYGTINTNLYHIVLFTVKKMKLFLPIYKHKHMSILRKMSGRTHTKLIMVFTSREGTKIGCDSQGDFRYRYNS